MPVEVRADLVQLDQSSFSKVAYEVMSEAFAVHKELGSLFDESVYRNALAERLDDVLTEVEIDVHYRGFRKVYFMDALVAGGAVFELKAVKKINLNHKAQLLNYLLLADLHHGKLINFGTTKVEHEFVNTTLTRTDRTSFAVEDNGWVATDGFESNEKELFLEILRDWGVGLDVTLYREVLFYFLGGADKTLAKLDVHHHGSFVGQQTVPVCGESTGIRLTAFQDGAKAYRQELIRLMQATGLKSLQWINVTRKKVTFETLHFSVSNISVPQSKDSTTQNSYLNRIYANNSASVPEAEEDCQ